MIDLYLIQTLNTFTIIIKVLFIILSIIYLIFAVPVYNECSDKTRTWFNVLLITILILGFLFIISPSRDVMVMMLSESMKVNKEVAEQLLWSDL